jgi:hypothetical protein
MTVRVLIFIFLSGTISNSFAQSTLDQMCQQVLFKNIPDSSFSYDQSNKTDGHNEIILKYLGKVRTKSNRIFKVLTYKLIWGSNFHTSARIIIFNDKNKTVGQYHLGDGADLPTKLVEAKLMFPNSDKSTCDKNVLTYISLKNGLPNKMFIKCQGQFGDLYNFSAPD